MRTVSSVLATGLKTSINASVIFVIEDLPILLSSPFIKAVLI